MAETRPILTMVAVALAAVGAVSPTTADQAAPVQRTVFVSATDERGAHLTDLVAADLVVKDGGREREIVRVQPANERLRVAVAVDELLAPITAVRQAVINLVQRLRESGEFALYLVGRVTERRVNYTVDVSPFLHAVNSFPAKASFPGNVVEATFQIARDLRPLEGRRAIVMIAPEISQVSALKAEGVFSELRDGGIVMHTASFVGWRTSPGTLQEVPATRLEGGDLTQSVERDRVLGDGPKQTGGLNVPSTTPDGFAVAVDRIAEDLRRQWRVTYLLPPGTRTDGRVTYEVKRKGMRLRGPSRLPELR